MIRFGFHMRLSSGLQNVPDEAIKLQCKTMQIFSRNPRGWHWGNLNVNDTKIFVNKKNKYDIKPIVIHMPYLPNPASPDNEKWNKSLDSLIEELKRAEILNAEYVNIHVGKSMGADIEEALKRVVKSIDLALNKVRNNVMLLLENTAGQGTEIGYDFEHLKFIIDNVKEKNRVGVCLDTAHLFGAGYDLRTKDAVKKTFLEFDKIVGLNKLFCIHYNDSKAKLGSNVDRHWHIGEGEIGDEGMLAIITYKKLSHLPFIMETPKKTPQDDFNNLKKVLKYLNNKFWI